MNTIYIKGNHNVTYEVSIDSSSYDESRKEIRFRSSTFCGAYFLNAIMFNDDGLPAKLDQSLFIDHVEGAEISGEEMAKARTWAWKQIKMSK